MSKAIYKIGHGWVLSSYITIPLANFSHSKYAALDSETDQRENQHHFVSGVSLVVI